MIIVLLMILLAALAALIICPIRIFRNPRATKAYRWVTVVTGVLMVLLSYLMTFHFVYMTNENTRVHGWPVPVVIFQRATPEGPWLDYVGATTMLGFPVNLVLLTGAWFLFLWLVSLMLYRRQREQ